jgi:hypothetical protein
MRILVSLIAAAACLAAASWVDVPLVSFGLFVVALGCVFDVATKLFERATGTGGMRDYRQ